MREFRVVWPVAAMESVRRSVGSYRFPPGYEGDGWRYGCDATFLRKFCEYWTERYDWAEAERRLNRYPQYLADIDGLDIHFVHVVGEAEGQRPLLISHGWPSSHREFWQVVEPLAFPSRHGGRSEDAFDLVIPSLPNFGFSGKPDPAVDPRQTAALFNRLMTGVLGYPRYRAHGGDWGAQISAFLALDHRNHLSGIHLTMLYPAPATPLIAPEATAWAARMQSVNRQLCGYSHLQNSKPQSLSWALGDSPVGQAAWIIERFHDWADLKELSVEQVFSMEDLLDTVMIYVMTGAFHSSLRFYSQDIECGLDQLPQGTRIEVPTAFTWFRDPLQPQPPRTYVSEGYNVVRWTEMPRGGHFPALEVPSLLVQDLRDWARDC